MGISVLPARRTPLWRWRTCLQCADEHIHHMPSRPSAGRYCRWQIARVPYVNRSSVLVWATQKTLQAYWLASSLLSMGLRNNGLHERHAAMVKMGPKQRNTVPRTSICSRSISLAYQAHSRHPPCPIEGPLATLPGYVVNNSSTQVGKCANHVPSKRCQLAVRLDSSELLENGQCLVHSRDIGRVNRTRQERL